MAVTKSSGDKSESPVGEIKSSPTEVADPVPCEFLNQRKPNGASTGNHGIHKGISEIVKRCKQRRTQTENSVSDSLSDIDDTEVVGYLNTKEEMQYKRVLWEAIYGKYVNAKKQRRPAERKKGASLKKVSKNTEKVKSPKRSSRINYDALKILNEEFEQGSKASQLITTDSHTLVSDETSSLERHRSNASNGGDLLQEMNNDEEETFGQHEMSHDEENETFGRYGGDLYDEYGDERYNCFEFD